MGSFCYKTANVWAIIGNIILILKILIPIVIIVLGAVDFGKTIISNDDKAFNKSLVTLIKKVVVGVVIFFVPTLINAVFSIISGFSNLESDYMNCVNCLTSPNDLCDTSYQGEIFNQ